MLANNPLDPLGCHAAVDEAIGPDQQHRALGADAQAVGLGAQHDPAWAPRTLEAQLAHQAFEGVPAGGTHGWIGAAEGLGRGGAEQQVVRNS